MEYLKMSTINGGHYQLRISLVRAATADGYALSWGASFACSLSGRAGAVFFSRPALLASNYCRLQRFLQHERLNGDIAERSFYNREPADKIGTG
ncbi:MAG: hypothetical protein H5U15_06190 [Roseovarius sp.]|nr:hypothetical protein [Roseovarius sp.]MBC7216269.1 hypothetical protein [Burkholderiaceae bacterium]